MTHDTETRTDPIKILGVILPRLPMLILRSGGELLRFKSKARKAARIFHDELRRQGLDQTAADKLTQTYLEGSDPFRLLRLQRRRFFA